MITLETLREDQAAAAQARPAAPRETNGTQWVSAPRLAAELGISRRTLARWLLHAELGFPAPKIVNHRLYFERSGVDAWKTLTAVKTAGARGPMHARARAA
jgi:hypothetical protein